MNANDIKSDNKGLRVKRARTGEMENIFAISWIEENKPISWLNQGRGVLQNLFIGTEELWPFQDSYYIKLITKRERMIVATVVQWLGSNCGFCFLQKTLRKCGYRIVKEDQ